MRRALLLLALAIPGLVRAQTTAGSISFVPDGNIGVLECNPANGETIEVRWSVSSTSLGAGTYRVYASTRAPTSDTTGGVKLCDTGPVAADGVWAGKIGGDITATTSAAQSEDFPTSAFVTATAAPGADTCAENLTRTIYVCVHFFPLNQSTATASATGQLEVDLRAPAKPTIKSITPGENALRVSWSEGTGGAADTVYYHIKATTTDPRDPKSHETGNITGESGRIEGLTEGVEYQVTVTAFSSADNPSAPSDPVAGTPVPVSDFWEHYHDDLGGQEQGGCASGPAGALGILGAALALAFRRRK